MKKKTMKAWAFGLTLAMAVAATGDISPAGASATAKVSPAVPAKEESRDGSTQVSGWQIDGDWVANEDTTVTDEVRKMVMDTMVHAVGAGREPIMYLGSQVTEDGINHCILCRTFPVIPYPIYHYALYYVHEKPAGTYEIYNVRQLEESEYAEYSEIRFITLSKRSIKIKKGKKKTVSAVYFPETETVGFKWESTNRKVATVKNGVIKAKKKGSCYITCSVEGSEEIIDACYVTVK